MQLISSLPQVPRRATLQKNLEGMETRKKDVGNLGILQPMFWSSHVGVFKQAIASQITSDWLIQVDLPKKKSELSLSTLEGHLTHHEHISTRITEIVWVLRVYSGEPCLDTTNRIYYWKSLNEGK